VSAVFKHLHLNVPPVATSSASHLSQEQHNPALEKEPQEIRNIVKRWLTSLLFSLRP
jgi:hypothetical protein